MLENEIVEIEKSTVDVVSRAKAMVVKDNATYEQANLFIGSIKAVAKEVKNTFAPIVSKAFETHKEAKAQEKKHLSPLLEAEKFLKQKTTEFYVAQERIRREKEEKLQRIEQEKARKERERIEVRAKIAEEKGKTEKAKELKQKAESVIPTGVCLSSRVPKQEGVRYRNKWTGQIENFIILPDQYKEPKQSAINSFAQMHKGQVAIPGVKFVCEKIQVNKAW